MALDPAVLKKYPHVYETTAPASRIKLDCQAIEEFDQKMEARGKLAFWLIIIGVVGSVITLCVSGNGGFLILLKILLALFVCMAVFGIILNILSRLNIPDLRYQFLPKLLETLGRDADPNEPFYVRLECSPTNRPAKKVETVPHSYRRGWKVDKFEDPWLVLAGTFVDGTDFSLSLTEFAIAQYGWKRSRSGKRKHKRKEKSKGVVINLELQIPRKRYGAIQVLQEDVQNAIQLADDVRLKRIKISDHSFTLGIKAVPRYITAGGLQMLTTQLMLNAYHVLTLAQKLSKPTG